VLLHPAVRLAADVVVSPRVAVEIQPRPAVAQARAGLRHFRVRVARGVRQSRANRMRPGHSVEAVAAAAAVAIF
jgi:hypothetical protein